MLSPKFVGIFRLATLWLVASVVHADALVQRTVCVWDLMGANGDNYSLMKDYRIAAREWGVDVKLKAYSDELMTLWLADQIYAVVKDEKLANKALQVAEKKINFIKRKKK